MKCIAVLISNTGTGSNLQAMIRAISSQELPIHIGLVLSDSAGAKGLNMAKRNNIPTRIITKQDDTTSILNKNHIDYVALAGWKRIIPRKMMHMFKNRILNLHPGLIPDTIDGVVVCPDGSIGLWNRGLFAEKAVENTLKKKASYIGSTIHLLSNEFDFGPVLEQCFVKIKQDDTIDSLYSRLKKEEHKIYIKALKKISNS